MLTPKQLDKLPDNLVALYSKAETDIIIDMARRITTYDYFIPAAQWQYIKAREMGFLHDEIIKRLSLASGISNKQIEQLMKDAGAEALKTDDAIYKSAGLEPKPLSASPELQTALSTGIKKTQGLFRNLTKTTANTATKQFENMLDRVYMQITTGTFDYNSSIRTAIKDLASKGVATIQYPSGHVDYMEVAVRRATVTGVNQTAAKLQEARANEMESDLVETTAHAGARPDHAEWQGKIFSRSGKHSKYPDFVSSTGYGTGDGLCGWNCRHNFYPYFEGIPEPVNTEKELEEMNALNYEYNGKKMTEYEASQKQRHIERQIRRWKREEQAFKGINFPTDEATAKVRQWQGIQRDFINQTGLRRQYDREKIGKVVVNAGKDDIIKLGKISENYLEKLSLEDVRKFNGKLSDRAARKWYKYHDEQIPKLIEKSKSLEEQARQACEFRNQNRTHARDLMRDQKARRELDLTEPNKSFEELLSHKIDKKGMTREEALKDIIKTATKTRNSVNKKLGLED